MVMPGDQITETDERGQRVVGETYALLLNADREAIPFRLGTRRRGVRWRSVFDTAEPGAQPRLFEQMDIFPLQPRSFVLLQAETTSG